MIEDRFQARAGVDNTNPGRVFSGIALTVLDPANKWAYTSNSCYHHVAKAIKAGGVQDDDRIVLLGRGKEVYHGIVTRAGQIHVDDFAVHGAPFLSYSEESGIYFFQDVDNRPVQTFDRVASLPFSEFKERYNAKTLNIGNSDATFNLGLG